MSLDSYFEALKLNTGASHFVIAEDRAVRTVDKKMESRRPSLKSTTTRTPPERFATAGCDQPLCCPMRHRAPSLDDSDRSVNLDGSFRFCEKPSGSRWSPPTFRKPHVSNDATTQSRRSSFNSSSRSR
ncbi:unnamed protein product [Cylindrotheca closterium]|uniref:Uncharacterized protein n=1 Tax=Cylindrotheca closterium TaxID=2856 RepID=A0AAD2FMA4_9STRA|nr:unnamed protein product [Cylindrotheca closterium]